MASCIKISQSLKQICCDGTTALSGSATINLVGPSTSSVCRLYDAADSTSVPTGPVGTFAIVNDAWESCELPCLEDLVHGSQTAVELGFYYSITVSISGYSSCTYQVVLDCTTMGLTAGDTVPLEDLTLTTPITPLPGSALCSIVQDCQTVTTMVDNGNNTVTYTNEAGTQVTFSISGGAGGGTSEDGGPYTIAQAVNNDITITDTTSNETVTITAAMIANAVTDTDTNTTSTFTEAAGILTHTDGNGSTTTVNLCDVIAANCENALAFNAGTGALTLTLHDGSSQTVNIGGNETVTTMVISANGDRVYTNEAGAQTLIPHETTTNVVEGPAGTFTHTNEDGATTAWVLPTGGAAETVTTLTANGTTGFTYSNENGTNTAITFPVAPADVTTTIVANGTTGFTYTNEVGTASAITFPVSAAETTTTVVEGPAGTFTYTNEIGTTTSWVLPTGGAAETVTTLAANGTTGFTYTNENGTATAITFPVETTTTLVDGNDGSFTYTDETGVATVWSETVTTLTNNVDGTYTYTNEAGLATIIGSVDGEKTTFQHPDLITATAASGLDVYDTDIEIYGYTVTVDTAPTGAETFDLIDRGTGAGNTNIFSGTLANGTLTTGIQTLGTAYVLTAGNLLQSNILTVNGSEKWTLHVFYREVRNELG